MAKSYFNSMITGNSAMLACVDDRGELIRLFWPDIDYLQHIGRLTVGLNCPQLRQETLWLHSDEWKAEQHYTEDTNIAVTAYFSDQFGLKITQSDFVLPDQSVLMRCYEVENTGALSMEAGFTVYSSAVSTNSQPGCILYEHSLSALIHYKHDYYYSISSGIKAAGYQLGGNAEHNAGRGGLQGHDVIGMMHDGALQWEKKQLAAGEKIKFVIYICLARDLNTLKALTWKTIWSDPLEAKEKTAGYWRDYLKGLKQANTGNPAIDVLYRRSLLVFALMTNKKTGALLAAPEIDEEFTRCGRYAYCWGRDAAFITAALDKTGLHSGAEDFYRWAARVQDEDGSWQQRYHMDGNLAPSWGLQIDEGGSIILGILKHYEACGDKAFLTELWPCVKKGVDFLIRYVDGETGLPRLSFDLWEERLGEHAYSTAAVCAGIEAGVRIAQILEFGDPFDSEQVPANWHEAAVKMREALERNFWKPEWNRFVRSVRVKQNAWGEESTNAKVWLKMNENSIARDYSLLDGTVDISLLGLCVPFGIYSSDDARMEATAHKVEQVLAGSPAGGLLRYEHDSYIGGNPWIIATLWAALFHIEKKSYAKAREYFYWAIKGTTDQGLLPEQIDRNNGRPAWVIPLTWSHAMFILVLDALIGAGEL